MTMTITLQIKPKEVYMEWLEQLKQHRLYRQHILSFKEITSPTEELPSPTSPSRDEKDVDKELSLVEKDLSHLQGILDSIQQSQQAKKDDDNKLRDFVVLAKEGKFWSYPPLHQ